MEFKKIFLFFLTVLFCCDVGESDHKLKVRCFSSNVLCKKCSFISVNETIHQNVLLQFIKPNLSGGNISEQYNAIKSSNNTYLNIPI